MSQKKVVGRNVAIALGIVCIILAVGMVGAIAVYVPRANDQSSTIASLNSQIASLNSQIADKDNTISSLHSQITSKDYTISSLNSQVTSLQSQVNDLTSIVNLGESVVWVNDETVSQPAGSYTTWTPAFSASYAGYVTVQVFTSTTSNTYVRVIYSSHGVNYDNQIGVGTGGTAVFPILPTSSIDIRVGNSNWLNGATETVTVTYYY